jgi:hypothetical protein
MNWCCAGRGWGDWRALNVGGFAKGLFSGLSIPGDGRPGGCEHDEPTTHGSRE